MMYQCAKEYGVHFFVHRLGVNLVSGHENWLGKILFYCDSMLDSPFMIIYLRNCTLSPMFNLCGLHLLTKYEKIKPKSKNAMD